MKERSMDLNRRTLLSRAAALALAELALRKTGTAQSSTTQTVQVRVFQLPRPGSYVFQVGKPVELYRDGRLYARGTTSGENGRRGTVNFKNLPVTGKYTARAMVNGVWYSQTAVGPLGGGLRIDIQVP
jgi:hypothetical protein